MPNIATYKGLSGNDLLAALAADATTCATSSRRGRPPAKKIGDRLPNWRLAERLVASRAQEQQARSGRPSDGAGCSPILILCRP